MSDKFSETLRRSISIMEMSDCDAISNAPESCDGNKAIQIAESIMKWVKKGKVSNPDSLEFVKLAKNILGEE